MELLHRSAVAQEQPSLFATGARLRAKPFLKWAGGKTHLLPTLRRCIPQRFKRYFEPFLGGGALFFDLGPAEAVISDSNPELIQCYETVRDSPEELIGELSKLKVSESEFYRIRALRPERLPGVARAARFIYLNKTCFNGVYRVNKKGLFNTPFGGYSNVSLANAENLRRASRVLQTATLRCGDYSGTLELAQEGDFIYLDPPYLPVGRYSDFKRYTKESFYEADHKRLAEVFRNLSNRRCFVLLSNSYHQKIASLYAGFHQAPVRVPRYVSCKAQGRGNVSELIIANYKLPILI